MFDGDGREYTAFAIVLIAIIGLIGFAVHGSYELNEKRSSYYYERCAESSGYGQSTQRPAGAGQGAAQSQNIRRYAPDWCDLATQETVAEAASASVYAAWATAGITALGLVLLSYTLFYTRRTLDQSARAASAAVQANSLIQNQQRPWLTVRRELNGMLTFTTIPEGTPKGKKWPAAAHLVWKYDPENVGQTPAFGLFTRQKLVCTETFFDRTALFEEFWRSINLSNVTDAQNTVFPGERRSYLPSRLGGVLDNVPSPETHLWLFFAIGYRSYNRDIYGLEARLFEVSADFRTFGPWSVAISEDSQARITL
ncbi:MAG: hypothetical protein AAF234_02360 [Pseudomonadota bacterium]